MNKLYLVGGAVVFLALSHYWVYDTGWDSAVDNVKAKQAELIQEEVEKRTREMRATLKEEANRSIKLHKRLAERQKTLDKLREEVNHADLEPTMDDAGCPVHPVDTAEFWRLFNARSDES